jgi:ATP-dependent Clp protease ATP-binding subunit ClpA
MKPYSVTASNALFEARAIADLFDSPVIESSMLLLGLAMQGDGEAGSVLNRFGVTPDVAFTIARDNWKPRHDAGTVPSPSLSPLCGHILRRASRKASWRREKEITTGRILHVFLRRLSGGDLRILRSQKVRRRRARRAIRLEVKLRRTLRIRFEGGEALALAKDRTNRFHLGTYPPRRFAKIRFRRARRRLKRADAKTVVLKAATPSSPQQVATNPQPSKMRVEVHP